MQLIAKQRERRRNSGYVCGDDTRARIVTAAIRMFGERGYEQVSTREIAAQAGVAPPALQYYFGGKEGLHVVCAQAVANRFLLRLAPNLAAVAVVMKSGRADGAAWALETVLSALIDSIGCSYSRSWTNLVVSGDGVGPGAELIRDKVNNPVIFAVAGLLNVASDGRIAGDEACLRTLFLLSQSKQPVNTPT